MREHRNAKRRSSTDGAAEPDAPVPALRPFSQSLPMALLRARESVMRHFRPSLQAAGLTEQQWRTLRAVSDLGEVEVTRLAAATFLLPSSLSRILRDLERRDVISRRSDPTDGRGALISLAPTGWAMLNEIGGHSEAVYRAIESRLGPARIHQLMEALAAMESDLDSMTPVEL